MLGVVLVGLVWFLHSLANTLQHIMPGYSGGISTSMEPRDYVFRRMPDGSKSEESERQPLEWHLRLPRAFVTDENGKSGVVNKGALRGGDTFFLTAQMLVSPDGKTFVPTAGQPPERQMERSLVVHLSNRIRNSVNSKVRRLLHSAKSDRYYSKLARRQCLAGYSML